METIELPCCNITVTLYPPDAEGCRGGHITSDLKEDKRKSRLNAAIDALESMILSCACAGIDITSPAFVEAVDTTVDAIDNQFT